MKFPHQLPEGILLLGPLPPPSGGIASHILSVHRRLSAKEGEVTACHILNPSRRRLGELLGAITRARLSGWLVHLHVCGHNRPSFMLGLLVGTAMLPWIRSSVLTIHSGLAPDYLGRLSVLERAAVRRVLALYGQVVAVNHAIARELDRVGGKALRRPVEVIPAWVDATPPRDAAFLEARRNHEFLICAHLGEGSEYGMPDLLDVFSRVSGTMGAGRVGLVMLGNGSVGDQAEQAISSREDIAPLCYAVGDLDHEKALEVMGECDLFLRPTLADGDSGMVREALILGLEVVATDVVRRPPGVITSPVGNVDLMAQTVGDCLHEGVSDRPGTDRKASKRRKRAAQWESQSLHPLLRVYSRALLGR